MCMPNTPPNKSLTDPHIAHQTDGRLRLRLASWPALTQDDVEWRLRRVDGVLGVRATPLTRGILLRYDPAATTVEHLLAAVRALVLPTAGHAAPAEALSLPHGTHASVPIARSHETQAAHGLPAGDLSPAATSPTPSAPALPVYLTPLADVMAWANEAIAQPSSPDAAPPTPAPAHVLPGEVGSQLLRSPLLYVRRLLDVFRRLDTAALALKTLSALAGVACAATPLALVLSLVEIAQLLVDLHLRTFA